MNIWTEPRDCARCGDHAPWMIESIDGDGKSAIARACDDHLADVLREHPDVQPVVTELV